MKLLNTEATYLLLRFIDRLQGSDLVTLELDGHFPLRITQGQAVYTTEGWGLSFTIGQLCDAPNISYQAYWKLIVIPPMQKKGKTTEGAAFPVFFRDDLNGIEETPCRIQSGTLHCCEPELQQKHARIIHQCLHNWTAAGYLA